MSAMRGRTLQTLSGGQRQRAFIAKLLAGEPELLILDEPTAGVDAAAQEALAALLDRLRRELGVTILYVSHEFGAIEPYVGRLVVVSGARSSSTVRRTRSRSAGTTLRIPTAISTMSLLDLEFMRLALATGAVVGILAPAVGFFLVQRHMSLIGDGVGHLAFAGVAAGYLFGISPVATALVASVAGAIGIEWLRGTHRTAGDQALALFFYGGIALGVVFVSAAEELNANLFTFLFGSILTVTRGDLVLVAALGLAALVTILALYRGLVAVAIDEEGARVSGIPVQMLNVALAALVGLTIALSMRIVGILLIGALMVLPVMTATRLANSLQSALTMSMGIGLVSVLAGLVLSYYLNLAPGGAIVLLAAALFGMVAAGDAILTARRA